MAADPETVNKLLEKRKQDFLKRIEKSDKAKSFLKKASPAERQAFLQKSLKRYEDIPEFRVPVGTKEKGFLEKGLEAVGLDDKKPEIKTRPLLSRRMEQSINAINQGKIDPNQLGDQELAQVIKEINTLAQIDAVDEDIQRQFRLVGEQRLREKETPSTVSAEPGGQTESSEEESGIFDSAKAFLSRPFQDADKGVEFLKDKALGPEGPVRDVAAQQFARGALSPLARLSDFGSSINPIRRAIDETAKLITGEELPSATDIVDDNFPALQGLEEAVRGDVAKDFQEIGAVSTLVAGGGAAGMASRGIGVLRGLAAQGFTDAVLATAAEPELPGLISELAGVKQNTTLSKVLTGAEGAAFAVLGNLVTGGSRRAISGEIRESLSGKFKKLKELMDDAEDKMDEASDFIAQETGIDKDSIKEMIDVRIERVERLKNLTPQERAARLEELNEVFNREQAIPEERFEIDPETGDRIEFSDTRQNLERVSSISNEGVATAPDARDARLEGLEEAFDPIRFGTKRAEQSRAARSQSIPKPKELTDRQLNIIKQIEDLPEIDFSAAEKEELTSALLRGEDEFMELFRAKNLGKATAEDLSPSPSPEPSQADSIEGAKPEGKRLSLGQKRQQLLERQRKQRNDALAKEASEEIDELTGQSSVPTQDPNQPSVTARESIDLISGQPKAPEPTDLAGQIRNIEDDLIVNVPRGTTFADMPANMQQRAIKQAFNEPTILGQFGEPRTGPTAIRDPFPPANPIPPEPPITFPDPPEGVFEPMEVAPLKVGNNPTKTFEVKNANGDIQTINANSAEEAARSVAPNEDVFQNTSVLDVDTGEVFKPDGGKLLKDNANSPDADILTPPDNSVLKQGQFQEIIDWADAIIRESNNKLRSNIDPMEVAAYAVKGAQLAVRGFVKAKDWSQAMIREFGSSIARHLGPIWEKTKDVLQKLRYNFTWNRTLFSDATKNLDTFKVWDGDGFVAVNRDEFIADIRVAKPQADAQVEIFRKERVPEIMRDFAKYAKRNGQTFEQYRKELNKYGQARHAREYNEAYGDGAAGMTNKEAESFLSQLSDRARRNYQSGLASIREINEEALRARLDAGLISEDTFNAIKEAYPNYVSLRRIIPKEIREQGEDTVTKLYLGGQRFRGSGLKRSAGGSEELEVADIFESAVANWEDATRRSAANRQNVGIAETMRANQDAFEDIATISTPQPIKKVTNSKGIERLIYDSPRPEEIPFYENGKYRVMRFNDKDMANSVASYAWYPDNPVTKALYWMLKAPLRLRATMLTSLDADFAIGNFPRDTEESIINLKRNVPDANTKRYMARLPGAARDLLFAELATTGRRISPGLMDAFGVKPDDLGPVRQRVQEAKRNGALVGGIASGPGSEASKIIESAKKLATKQEKLPLKAVKELFRGIQSYNSIVENMNRYATYREALDSGLSVRRAVQAARDSSFDPSRVGAFTPLAQAWFMFINPFMQSFSNVAKSFNPASKGGRKRLAKTMGTLAAAQGAVSTWNESIFPGWREKMEKGDPYNYWFNLPIIIGRKTDPETGEEVPEFVPIPIAYPLQMPKRMFDMAYSELWGYESKSGAQITSEVWQSFEDSFLPIAASRGIISLAPSGYTPFFELDANRDWQDTPIYRDDLNPLARNFTEVFDGFADRPSGRAMIAFTESLNNMGIDLNPEKLDFLLRQYFSGPYKLTDSVSEAMNSAMTGEPLDTNQIVVLRRFFRRIDADVLKIRDKMDEESLDMAKDIYNAHKRERQRARWLARRAMEVAETDPEKARQMVQEKIDEGFFIQPNGKPDVELWDYMNEYMETRGKNLTSRDRTIMALGKRSGDRARLYYQMLKKMENDEERNEFIQDQAAKGLLDEKVWRQIIWFSRQPVNGLVEKSE